MFQAKTKRIKQIASYYSDRIERLEEILFGKVNVYIDYANVRPWSNKLKWNIDIKRLKQFLDSFNNIQSVKLYNGTLDSDQSSKKFSKEARKLYKENYKTKAVKIMKQSINYSSINPNSTDLLEKFIRKCLLLKYKLKTITFLNDKFKEMNLNGIYYIEDRKCNFDVEIGRDMLLDYKIDSIDTFILWSGDSDFYEPIKQLLKDNKKVILFATVRRISSELNKLQKDGLLIYDIQKIRNFICFKKQIDLALNNAKRTSCEAPKLWSS